jgi:hypothetical protein
MQALSDLLLMLTAKLGLETASEDHRGPDAIPDLTFYTGHSPSELGDLLGQT